MKTVIIRLLATAMIDGVPRSPVEGLQTVSEAEAERLIEAGQAEDASDEVAGDPLDHDGNGKKGGSRPKPAKDA
jgi:hypothetical protein